MRKFLFLIMIYIYIYKVKVKQSRNRPGVAQRVLGCLGSPDFHDIRHMKVVRLSASRTGRLYLKKCF